MLLCRSVRSRFITTDSRDGRSAGREPEGIGSRSCPAAGSRIPNLTRESMCRGTQAVSEVRALLDLSGNSTAVNPVEGTPFSYRRR